MRRALRAAAVGVHGCLMAGAAKGGRLPFQPVIQGTPVAREKTGD